MRRFVGKRLPIETLQQPALCLAFAYWREKRGDRTFPSRKDIAPEEMRTYLANVMLVEVARQPLDFVYRVFGSGIAAAHGEDYTNKSVRDLQPPEFAALIWDQYADVLEKETPQLHGVVFQTESQYHEYQRLTLPLSSNGVTIDKLLAVSIEDRDFWDTVAKAAR